MIVAGFFDHATIVEFGAAMLGLALSSWKLISHPIRDFVVLRTIQALAFLTAVVGGAVFAMTGHDWLFFLALFGGFGVVILFGFWWRDLRTRRIEKTWFTEAVVGLVIALAALYSALAHAGGQ